MQISIPNRTNQKHTDKSPTTTRFTPKRMLFFFLILVVSTTFFIIAYRHMEKYHHQVPPVPMVATSLAKGIYAPISLKEECGQQEQQVFLMEQQQPQDEKEINQVDEDNDNPRNTCATTTTASTTSSFCESENGVVIERVHVIILVHGWLGCPQDLGYVHHAIERSAAKIAQDNNTTQNNKHEPILVHTCVSNNGRTHDGLEKGANRIAQEVQQVLESVKNQYNCDGSLQEITLSMVGYSLGGIYSRYALPQIVPPINDNNENKQFPRVVPKVFCTIATPHLGCKGHTFMHMPGVFDLVSRFTRTSRDLFRHSPILKQTVMDRRWTQPLLQFEKRIAYANAYGMDLMVPTSTAAFLSTESPDSEHFHIEGHPEHPFMALVVETPARHHLLLQEEEEAESAAKNVSRNNSDDAEMARRLDAMGWTKVFVDFTDSSHQPKSSKAPSSSFSLSSKNSSKAFRAAELHSEFHPPKPTQKLYLPNGHDLIAVNSKNVMSSFLFRRGRSLVDQLAHDLLRDITKEDP